MSCYSYCIAAGIAPTLVVQCHVYFKTSKKNSTNLCRMSITLTVSHTETLYVQFSRWSRFWFLLQRNEVHVYSILCRHNLKRTHLAVKNIYPRNVLPVLCNSFWDDMLIRSAMSSLMCTTDYQRFSRLKMWHCEGCKRFLLFRSNEAGKRSLYLLK